MLPNEILYMIAERCDWSSLENMKLASYRLYQICKLIEKKRIYSCIPLGEKSAMLKVKINDIMLKNISVVYNDKEYFLLTYNLQYVKEILKRWFIFSFNQDEWILTGKIIKSIIRLHNKLHNDIEGDTLYFGFDNHGESYLKYIL